MAFPTSPTDGQTYKNYVYNGSEGIWRHFYRTEVLDQALPVGMMYVQFPGQLDPAQMSWPGTWSDVTSDYADAFFRAEGTNSQPFDNQTSAQLDAFQKHQHYFQRSYSDAAKGDNDRDAENMTTQQTWGYAEDGGGAPRTASETRPLNYTIRIFKRVS